MIDWYTPEVSDRWESVLGLRDYAIDYRVVTDKEMDDLQKQNGYDPEDACAGLCFAKDYDREATIYLRENADELTMVHELVHIVLDELTNYMRVCALQLPAKTANLATFHLKTLEERTVNNLAKALLAAKKA